MMKYKLSEWANIAEDVGAVANITSLTYFSIRVGDNANAPVGVCQTEKHGSEQ